MDLLEKMWEVEKWAVDGGEHRSSFGDVIDHVCIHRSTTLTHQSHQRTRSNLLTVTRLGTLG